MNKTGGNKQNRTATLSAFPSSCFSSPLPQRRVEEAGDADDEMLLDGGEHVAGNAPPPPPSLLGCAGRSLMLRSARDPGSDFLLVTEEHAVEAVLLRLDDPPESSFRAFAVGRPGVMFAVDVHERVLRTSEMGEIRFG